MQRLWIVIVIALAGCSQGHDVVFVDCMAAVPTCTADTEGANCAYADDDAMRTRFCTCESSVFVCNDCDTDAPPVGMPCAMNDRCVWESVEKGCVCACGDEAMWVCTPSRAGTTNCLP